MNRRKKDSDKSSSEDIPQNMEQSLSAMTERASLLDVFENFLGMPIRKITDTHLESLTPSQAVELVQQLDLFLEAASNDEFAEDAISLDGFASPIIIPYDPAEIRTTRRAKQVALAHSEVIFPFEEVGQNYRRFGRNHLKSLCSWSQRNEKLLRAHIFSPARTPEVFDAFNSDQIVGLAEWLMENLTRAGRESELQKFITQYQGKNREELYIELSPLIHSTLQDAVGGGFFGTGLSFTQAKTGLLYRFCAETLNDNIDEIKNHASLFAHTALLHDLELPALEDLSDEDFVSIRLESEDFGEFRSVLRRALSQTSVEVKEGHELNSSFRNNLDEVRWRAEILRRDIRDKTLAQYLKPAVQNVAIGSFVSTAAATAADSVKGPLDFTSLAARFGASAVLGMLFALLIYSPPSRQRRLLRFYDVLLD